ncbi:MAG: vitamin K epoxide reductase family protein [Anaerolineaceae bacterium]
MIRKIILIISLLGLSDATYLLIIKLTSNKALCVPGLGDCWSVNTSAYSEWNGIPISVFGMLAYLSIIAILLLYKRSEFFKTFSAIFVLGISLIGFIFSIYLTYLQFAVIKAICPFCIISAITMTTVFVLSIINFIKNQNSIDAFDN